jgi:hypothetical protein
MTSQTEVNIIVADHPLTDEEKCYLEIFHPEDDIIFIGSNLDMYDILLKFGFFKSKNDARKNWKQTGKDVPLGFNDFRIGKRKRLLSIFNPIKG